MIRLRNTYRNYTPEEILEFFQEEYKWNRIVDDEVDDDLKIEKEMPLIEWRLFQDLISWDKLHVELNKIFRINASFAAWNKAVWPEKKKLLWDICVFLSQHARKEVIQPITVLGKNCLGAAVFLTLKKNLLSRNVPVDDLKPSTPLSRLIDGYYGYYVFVEINMTGVKVFNSLRYKLKRGLSFWEKINIFNSERYCIDTGEINTFKDLSKKIAENLHVVQ